MTSNNPYQPSSPFMCSLPNGDILFSALNPALISSGVPCSLVKLHSADGRIMLASSGPHVPGLFGAVPGQVCAKFTGLNLLSGTYRVILEFSDRQATSLELVYNQSIKSSSPQAVKQLSKVGLALEALMNPAKNVPTPPAVKPPEPVVTVEPPKPKAPKIVLPPYNFFVDGVIGGVVEGWIWCPHKPANRYEVQAWSQGRMVGYGLANLYREDLDAKGKADGRIKFEIPLTRKIFDGQTHSIQIRVLGQGTPDVDMVLASELLFEAPNRPQRSEMLELLVDYDTTIQALVKFIQHHELSIPNVGLAVHRLALSMQNADPRGARKLIQELISNTNEHPMLQLKLAETYLMERKFDEAVGGYQSVLFDYGKSLYAYLGVAHCKRFMGHTNEALEAYSQALKLDATCTLAKRFIDSLKPKAASAIESEIPKKSEAPKAQNPKAEVPKAAPSKVAEPVPKQSSVKADPAIPNALPPSKSKLLGNPENAQLLSKLMELTRSAKVKKG